MTPLAVELGLVLEREPGGEAPKPPPYPPWLRPGVVIKEGISFMVHRIGFTRTIVRMGWRGFLRGGSLLLLAGISMGMTLHNAVEADDLDAVRGLILAGEDINGPNSVGHTPLHLVKSIPMAQWLIENGASLEAITDRGDTPLLTASAVGPPEVVSFLVNAGADARQPNPKTGFTVLHYIAWSEGREALAARMIEAGADVNARNRNLRTPLHVAANNLIEPLTGMLLAHGADPDALDEEGATPLMLSLHHFGVREPEASFLEMYFRSGFDPNTAGPAGLTALHLASARDTMHSIVKRLIELGADVEAEAELPGYGVSGFKPLHAAAWLGMGQTVAVLLEHGADIQARTSDGRTALHWAASPLRPGLPQTVFLVKELTGVLDTFQPFQDTDQRPVRRYLRKNGLPAIMKLIEHGAQPTARDQSGRTPLDAAQEAGYPDTAAYFQELVSR